MIQQGEIRPLFRINGDKPSSPPLKKTSAKGKSSTDGYAIGKPAGNVELHPETPSESHDIRVANEQNIRKEEKKNNHHDDHEENKHHEDVREAGEHNEENKHHDDHHRKEDSPDESVSSRSESPEQHVSFNKLETVLTRNNLLILCCFSIHEDIVEYIKVVNTNGRCCPFFISVGDDLRLGSSEKYRNIHLSRGNDPRKKEIIFRDYYHGDVVSHSTEQIERLEAIVSDDLLIIRENRMSVMKHGKVRIYFLSEDVKSCVSPLIKLDSLIKDIGEILSHVGFAYIKLQGLCKTFIDSQYKLFIKRLLGRYDEIRRHMQGARRNMDLLNDDYEFLCNNRKDCYRLSEGIVSKMLSEMLDIEEKLVDDQI